MTQRRALALTTPVLVAIAVAAACGTEDTGTGTDPLSSAPSTSDSASTTAPGVTVPSPAQSSGVPVPSQTTPVGTGSAPSVAPSASAPPVSSCTDTTYTANDNDNSVTAFPGVQNVYFFGDGATSECGTPTAGQLCVEGNAVPAESDYSHWGAGIGMQLSTTMSAFDLAAQGVTQVRFKLTGVAGRPVRVQMSQVNDPAITNADMNYEKNGFVWGGGSPMSTKMDKDIVIGLEEFEFPSWTKVLKPDAADDMDVAEGQLLDTTKVHSLQLQIASEPTDKPLSYSWCISQLEWLDAAGTPVVLQKLTPAPAGSDSAAPSTTQTAPNPSTSGSASTSSSAEPETGGAGGGGGGGNTPEETGGAGGGGGDEDPFDAAYEVFKVSCAGSQCHDEGAFDHPAFASMDRETSLMAATTNADKIGMRLTSTGMDKMPPMMALSADDLATVQAFLDSL